MNIGALLPLSGTVIWASGGFPGNWLRWAAMFLLSGLCGCLLFLLLHSDDGVPMLGASGAIFGLWGMAARLGVERGSVVPLRSPQVWDATRTAIIVNVVLFTLLFLLTWLLDAKGGLAWQAHAGGFAFGLLAAPWFVRARALPES